MERESAVREILQSIGPLFPEDAARARAARKQQAAVPAEADAAASDDTRAQMNSAPKPVLASQVHPLNARKTPVVNLAAVLERLTASVAPPRLAESVRDAVPDLVRPAVPDVAALRAALDARDEPAVRDEPVAEAAISVEPAVAEPVVAEQAPVVPVVEPATAVEMQPEPVVTESAPETEAVVETDELVAPTEPLAVADEIPEHSVEAVTSEEQSTVDEPGEAVLDSFVTAVADAILPSRAEPPSQAVEPVVEAVALTGEAGRPDDPDTTVVESPAEHEPVAAIAKKPSALALAETPVAKSPKPASAKAQRRMKSRKAAMSVAVEVEAATETPAPTVLEASTPLPARGEPEAAATRTSAEDDELIRQIRTHRADLIDVDDQLVRLDQQIASEKQEMARYVALVEQKTAYRNRLMRLRTSTQRFVETLQIKAEPVKRQPKKKPEPA